MAMKPQLANQGVKARLSALVSQLIRTHRDLWDETKADLSVSASAENYGSAIGCMLQGAAQNLLDSLSGTERQQLEEYARSRIPEGFPDRSCSCLMVGEVMVRAQRSLSRNGYYP
jgi:hypothetical protein